MSVRFSQGILSCTRAVIGIFVLSGAAVAAPDNILDWLINETPCRVMVQSLNDLPVERDFSTNGSMYVLEMLAVDAFIQGAASATYPEISDTSVYKGMFRDMCAAEPNLTANEVVRKIIRLRN